MHTGKSYKLPEFLLWTRRSIYVLLLLTVIPVVLYEVVGLTWLAIPWGVVFLLGATVALSAGFKNVQTYNRTQDAQQVWSQIASSSRIWGAMCRDLVADPARARSLMDRHLAWLAALRHQMREVKPWENADKAYNAEYLRLYTIPERERSLESELARYLPCDEVAPILNSRSKALQVLGLQSRATKAMLADGQLTMAGFTDMQKSIRDFQDLQGRSERIKNFPYPRQHAFINTLFVRILCVLLPFGMIGEFERLNDVVDGWARGHMVWFVIPLSLLICWMYTSLDQVGESTENPFEGGANDVPISQICEDVENDLRELLGEAPIAAAAQAESDIVM
ncbi:multidrug transporter [Lysobacter sp. S4-A87]|uniref:bestrophin family protein n=1 Tax=Lysobacter sp. S4-A87 TaxID=2925843 RepID=UPI001F53256D|nr:bestrophin family ion channel [Lysobacter sp. S4-A87]UNK47914.1 multidrug transporter [Lysobacter sp. S4-A87]